MYMPDSSDLNQTKVSPNQRLLSVQTLTVLALHDAISIADKSEKYTSYQSILDIADQLDPVFFGRLNLLERGRESELAIEYRQRADIESQEKNEIVLPANLVRDDIEKWRKYLREPNVEDREAVEKRLEKLNNVLNEFEPKEYSENKVLERDMKIGEDLPYASKREGILDLALPKGRILRLRLIHPDHPEDITGIDILFEQHHIQLKQARLAAIQYKMWEKQTLYTTQSNVEEQIKKLNSVFCAHGLCMSDINDTDRHLYRLNYCAAFLRPTNKLQRADAHVASIGYHIPICRVTKLWENVVKGKKLTYDHIRNESLTQRAFEELFCNEMLGSRWLPLDEIEGLFKKYDLLTTASETAIIYAQDLVGKNQ
jgi:hypothetical protein